MKYILIGLAAAAAITGTLYFVFRSPEEPEPVVEAKPPKKVRATKMADEPKPLPAAAAEKPAKRYYLNPVGQQFEFIGAGTVKMTSSKGETMSGTYTKEEDLVRLSFNNNGRKTTMELIETPHGMAGMMGGRVGAFLGTDDPEKITGAVRDSILEQGKKTRMEGNIATLIAYTQLYVTKNNGQPPSAAAGLRAIVTKGILTDETLLTDLWGNPVQYVTPATRSKDEFDIFSSGPNGIAGDGDDIGNWEPAKTGDDEGVESTEFTAFKKEVKALGERLQKTKSSVEGP